MPPMPLADPFTSVRSTWERDLGHRGGLVLNADMQAIKVVRLSLHLQNLPLITLRSPRREEVGQIAAQDQTLKHVRAGGAAESWRGGWG